MVNLFYIDLLANLPKNKKEHPFNYYGQAGCSFSTI
jgi:hypothetical protein